MLKINGEEVPDEVIEAEFSQIKGHYERTLQVACCERDPEFRRYAKENIAARVLVSQEALKAADEIPDEEAETALGKLVEDYGGADKFFMSTGMRLPEDKEVALKNVAASLRVDRFLADAYQPEPEYSDEELRANYEEHIGDFLTEEEIRVSHITKSLSGASSRRDVYNRLREVRQILRSGERSFDEVANEENDNGEQEIDLGYFKRGEFMEEFEALAFSMDVGEISPVFSTHLGLHITTVTGRKEAVPKPFEEVKETVRELMVAESREAKFKALVEKLKASAVIEDDDPDEEEGDNAHEH